MVLVVWVAEIDWTSSHAVDHQVYNSTAPTAAQQQQRQDFLVWFLCSHARSQVSAHGQCHGHPQHCQYNKHITYSFLFVTFILIEQPRAQDNFEPDYCLRILHHPVKLVFSSSNCKLSTSNDFDANGCNKIHNPGLMYSKPPAWYFVWWQLQAAANIYLIWTYKGTKQKWKWKLMKVATSKRTTCCYAMSAIKLNIWICRALNLWRKKTQDSYSWVLSLLSLGAITDLWTWIVTMLWPSNALCEVLHITVTYHSFSNMFYFQLLPNYFPNHYWETIIMSNVLFHFHDCCEITILVAWVVAM